MQWNGFHGLLGKVWRAFAAGFVGGALMSLTAIFDQLSKGADLGGNWPKALLSGVILGGMTAACRAVYAVLPFDDADKDVGLAKESGGETPTEAATRAATEAAKAATEAAKAATEAAQAANHVTERAAHAVDAVDALVEGVRLGGVAPPDYAVKPDGQNRLTRSR